MEIDARLETEEISLLPTILNQLSSSNSIKYELYIDPKLTWFRGHFDDLPILPGVTQIDWIMHLSQNIYRHSRCIHSIERLKFTKPIIPNTNLNCDITLESSDSSISFIYYDDSATYSSGRIVIANG